MRGTKLIIVDIVIYCELIWTRVTCFKIKSLFSDLSYAWPIAEFTVAYFNVASPIAGGLTAYTFTTGILFKVAPFRVLTYLIDHLSLWDF